MRHGNEGAREAGERRPGSRNLRPLRRVLGLLTPYRGRLAAALAALLVAAGTVLAFGQVLRALVDRGLAGGEAADLNGVLVLFYAVVALMAASVAARSFLVNWIGERVVADLRRAVFDRVLSLEPAFFETTRTGEVVSRLTTDTSLLQTVVGGTLAMSVRNALLFAGGLVLLAVTSPKLTGLVLLGVPLVVVPLWLLGHRVRRLSHTSQARLAEVGAYVAEVLYGIRTVQAFCHEAVDRRRYGAHVEGAFAAAVARARVSALLAGTVMLLVFGAVGLVLWVGGRDVLAARMSGGELSAFLFYAVLVASSVGSLAEVVGDLMRAAGAAERLSELLAREPRIAAPAEPLPLPRPARGAIALDALGFAYPSRPGTPVLDGLSLTIDPGERVAVVGPSGAGKSTLFQLLLRFYDPTSGAIRFDGVDLRRVDPAELRRRIALVPQDPVVFAADALENIRYGLDGISEAQVRAAADAAHATDFIERLPEGFHTFLGERGVRLSGGQRQRIAIARALLRDPALLLLDEATSALDAESERLVQDALERVMAGRTALVIAHRLATVRRVDRILVLDQGRLAAGGSHDELVAQGGLYARLAALQFREAAAAG